MQWVNPLHTLPTTPDQINHMNNQIATYFNHCLPHYYNFEVLPKSTVEEIVTAHKYLSEHVCGYPTPVTGIYYGPGNWYIVSNQSDKCADFYEFRQLVVNVLANYENYLINYRHYLGFYPTIFNWFSFKVPNDIMETQLILFLADPNGPVFQDLKFQFNKDFSLIPVNHAIITNMANQNLQYVYGHAYDPRVANDVFNHPITQGNVDVNIASISRDDQIIFDAMSEPGETMARPLFTKVYYYFEPGHDLHGTQVVLYNGLTGVLYEIGSQRTLSKAIDIYPNHRSNFPYTTINAESAKMFRNWGLHENKLHQVGTLFTTGPNFNEGNHFILGSGAEQKYINKAVNPLIVTDVPRRGENYQYRVDNSTNTIVKHNINTPTHFEVDHNYANSYDEDIFKLED